MPPPFFSLVFIMFLFFKAVFDKNSQHRGCWQRDILRVQNYGKKGGYFTLTSVHPQVTTKDNLFI